MKNKRKARVLALQVMYACDMRSGDDTQDIFDAIVQSNKNTEASIAYAKMLIDESLGSSGAIDALLQKHIVNWDLKRLSAIDRNILRLAIAELRINNDVPYKVVIDEAVEIAKQFGTDDSGKFVNGVIDSVYKEMKKTHKSSKE